MATISTFLKTMTKVAKSPSVNMVTSLSNEYIDMSARLKPVNDGLQTQAELQNKIFASANRAGSSYMSMAGNIAKLGFAAPDSFGSNDETIAFVELMQKSFAVGGANKSNEQAAMSQITKAMASGGFRGGELSSIIDNAPVLAQALADFAGVDMKGLEELFSKGAISADVIKGALFSASDDIKQKFADMPQTFAGIWTTIKDSALQAFAPVLEKINQFLNAPGTQQFIAMVVQGITLLGSLALDLVDAFLWLGAGIGYLYSVFEPVVAMVGGALALWAFTQIPTLLSLFNTMTIRLWLMIQPLLASLAVWAALNWPILLIGAAIGFIIYALYNWSDTTVEVIGIIGGIFAVFFATLYNRFTFLANMWLSIAEFLINVFKDPVYAVKKLFYDLVINALSYLSNLAKGIEDIVNNIT